MDNSNDLLRPYQAEAMSKCIEAIQKGKRKVLLEMSEGSGASRVLTGVAIALLQDGLSKNILWVSDRLSIQDYYLQLVKIDNCQFSINRYPNLTIAGITFITVQALLRTKCKIDADSFDTVILCGVNTTNFKFKTFLKDKLTIGLKQLSANLPQNSIFSSTDSVFKFYTDMSLNYWYQIEDLCATILKQYGTVINDSENSDQSVDIVLDTAKCKYLIEVKAYRNSYVSRSALETAIYKLSNLIHTNRDNIIPCIMVFSRVERAFKESAYKRIGVHVWDISNIIWLCGEDNTFLEQLSILSFHSLADITPEPIAFLAPINVSQKKIIETASKEDESGLLIQRLRECKCGRKGYAAQKYEEICGDILDYLFSDEFSQKSTQHKTNDELFRMDFLCAIKGLSDFWRLLIDHYNTRFVVFECKNYTDKLSQNLIYVTEKYLFNAALRNVAFIISRKGFNQNANAAALGCLKENGKLIVDLTDIDLMNMITKKSSGGEPSDYLLFKIETVLMSISK